MAPAKSSKPAKTIKSAKSPKRTGSRPIGGSRLFDWNIGAWLTHSLGHLTEEKGDDGKVGNLLAVDNLTHVERECKRHKVQLPTWIKDDMQKKKRGLFVMNHGDAPLWILIVHNGDAAAVPSAATLEAGPFGRARDAMGSVVAQIEGIGLHKLVIHTASCDDETTLGLLVGLEIASYSYLKALAGSRKAASGATSNGGKLPRLELPDVEQSLIDEAAHLGTATNVARHLVNTPSNHLHPESYASALSHLFADTAGVKLEVWDEGRLKKERMNLLLAVGQAAHSAPRLVHLKYRPKHAAKGAKPLAFVGKGVTFDSGGLDIKPSAAMRWMKKDMGGSAALVGLAWWIVQTEQAVPCDFYFALAENAVGGNAFRPGDTLVSRAGVSVEIHNTDAEGRLVLADAMDVAANASGADEPALMIDVATLTGAVKVGLGADIIGFFACDEHLAQKLTEAALDKAEPMWRLPLFDPYMKQMKSNVADMSNCSSSSFGGAMTAALFLKRFTKNKPWAHLDIYAWADGPNGAMREAGGSGQAVQLLAGFVEQWGRKKS